jgi:hypothetical protein
MFILLILCRSRVFWYFYKLKKKVIGVWKASMLFGWHVRRLPMNKHHILGHNGALMICFLSPLFSLFNLEKYVILAKN